MFAYCDRCIFYSVKKPFLQLSCTVWIREGPPWSLLTGCLEAPTPQWLSLRGCRASSALVPVAPLLSCSDPTVGETASHIFPHSSLVFCPFKYVFPQAAYVTGGFSCVCGGRCWSQSALSGSSHAWQRVTLLREPCSYQTASTSPFACSMPWQVTTVRSSQ